LENWGQKVRNDKKERERMFIRMIKKPIAIRCMMALAGIDVKKILRKRGKEDRVEERMVRVAISKFYAGIIFKALKGLV
jgi:hypothetical protein